MNVFETEEEALRDAIETGKEQQEKLCPLLRYSCTDRCNCYVQPTTFRTSNSNGRVAYASIGGACGNQMFYGE